MPTLAVLATIPGREAALAICLRSLRPQVDEIRVVCNGFSEPPAIVTELADSYDLDPVDQHGSAAKLRFAAAWTGLYLGCDDDLEYPADYVERMRGRVQRWKGRAIVTCHGRILKPAATSFLSVEAAWAPQQANPGAWINYPGGCAIAFDSRLALPAFVPGKNLEEAHLAVWAQRRGVPIWLAAHDAGWLRYLLNGTKLPTIWAEEKAVRFANRNRVLAPIGNGEGWKVYHA